MREYYSLHQFCIESPEDEDIAHLYLQECRLFDREYHYLEDVWTHPGHRGHGYARRLIAEALAYIASDPFSTGAIATTRYGRKVGETAYDLLDFYAQLGFETIGYEMRYDRWEAASYLPREMLPWYDHYGVLLAHRGISWDEMMSGHTMDPTIHRIYPYDPHRWEDLVLIDTTYLWGSSRYLIAPSPGLSEDLIISLAHEHDVSKYIRVSTFAP